MPEDVNRPGRAAALRRAAGDRPHRRDADDHRAPDRARRRLRGRGARAVQRRGHGALPGVPRYGAFSKRSLDELLAGARVDVAPYKRDPMDFVLWKPSGPRGSGLAVARPASRRPGRPGWHIECSAMAWRHLVKAFETRLACERSAEARDLRHPRRRHRPRLPAPRERDRPDLLRLRHAAHGQCVDAQRLPAGRGREDVEVARQLHHHPRPARRTGPARCCASTCCARITASRSTGPLRGLEESERTLDRWYGLGRRPRPSRSSAQVVLEALADDLNTPKMIAELHALDGAGDHDELVANLRALGFLRESARRHGQARRQAALAGRCRPASRR